MQNFRLAFYPSLNNLNIPFHFSSCLHSFRREVQCNSYLSFSVDNAVFSSLGFYQVLLFVFDLLNWNMMSSGTEFLVFFLRGVSWASPVSVIWWLSLILENSQPLFFFFKIFFYFFFLLLLVFPLYICYNFYNHPSVIG